MGNQPPSSTTPRALRASARQQLRQRTTQQPAQAPQHPNAPQAMHMQAPNNPQRSHDQSSTTRCHADSQENGISYSNEQNRGWQPGGQQRMHQLRNGPVQLRRYGHQERVTQAADDCVTMTINDRTSNDMMQDMAIPMGDDDETQDTRTSTDTEGNISPYSESDLESQKGDRADSPGGDLNDLSRRRAYQPLQQDNAPDDNSTQAQAQHRTRHSHLHQTRQQNQRASGSGPHMATSPRHLVDPPRPPTRSRTRNGHRGRSHETQSSRGIDHDDANEAANASGENDGEMDADTARVREIVKAAVGHGRKANSGTSSSGRDEAKSRTRSAAVNAQSDPDSPISVFSDPDETVEDITDFPRFGCCIPLSAANQADPDFVLVPRTQGGAMLVIPPFYEQHRAQQQQLSARLADSNAPNAARTERAQDLPSNSGASMLASQLANQLGSNAGLGAAQYTAARHIQQRRSTTSAENSEDESESDLYLTPGHHAQHHRVAARAVMRNQIDLRTLHDDGMPLTPEQESMALHYRRAHGLSAKAIAKLILVNHRKIFRHLSKLAKTHTEPKTPHKPSPESLKSIWEHNAGDSAFDRYEDFYTALRFPRLRHELCLILRQSTPLPRQVISLILDFAVTKILPGQPLDVLDDRGKELWYNACVVDVFRISDEERRLKLLMQAADANASTSTNETDADLENHTEPPATLPPTTPLTLSVKMMGSTHLHPKDPWAVFDEHEDDEAFEVPLTDDATFDSKEERDSDEDEDRIKEELQIYLPGNASKLILQAIADEKLRPASQTASSQRSTNAVALSQLSMQSTDSPADCYGVDPAEMLADPIIYAWLREQDMLDPNLWPKLVCLSAFGMECECNCECSWLGLNVPCREYEMGAWDLLLKSDTQNNGEGTPTSGITKSSTLCPTKLKSEARLVVGEPLGDYNHARPLGEDSGALQYEELFFETSEFQRYCSPLRSLTTLSLLKARMSDGTDEHALNADGALKEGLKPNDVESPHDSMTCEYKSESKSTRAVKTPTVSSPIRRTQPSRSPKPMSTARSGTASPGRFSLASGMAAAASTTEGRYVNQLRTPLNTPPGSNRSPTKDLSTRKEMKGSLRAKAFVSAPNSPCTQPKSTSGSGSRRFIRTKMGAGGALSPPSQAALSPELYIASRNSSTPTSPASSTSQGLSLPSLRNPPRHKVPMGSRRRSSQVSHVAEEPIDVCDDDCEPSYAIEEEEAEVTLEDPLDNMQGERKLASQLHQKQTEIHVQDDIMPERFPPGIYSCRRLTYNERVRLEQRTLAMQYVACRPRRSGHLTDCPFHLFALCRDHLRQKVFESRLQTRALKQTFFGDHNPLVQTQHLFGDGDVRGRSLLASSSASEAKLAAAAMLTRLTMKYGTRSGFHRSINTGQPENVSHRGEVLNIPAGQSTLHPLSQSQFGPKPGSKALGNTPLGVLVVPRHPLDTDTDNFTSGTSPPPGPPGSTAPSGATTSNLPPTTREEPSTLASAAARLGLGIGGFFGGLAAGLTGSHPPNDTRNANMAAGANPFPANRHAQHPTAQEQRGAAPALSAHARAQYQRMQHHQLPHQQPPQAPGGGIAQPPPPAHLTDNLPQGAGAPGNGNVTAAGQGNAQGLAVAMLPQAYLAPSMRRYRYADEGPNSSLKCDQVLVHYLGWHRRWDEWLPIDSHRLAAPGSRTSGRATGPDFAGAKVAPTAAPEVPRIALVPEPQRVAATSHRPEANSAHMGLSTVPTYLGMQNTDGGPRDDQAQGPEAPAIDATTLSDAGAELTRYIERDLWKHKRRMFAMKLKAQIIGSEPSVAADAAPLPRRFTYHCDDGVNAHHQELDTLSMGQLDDSHGVPSSSVSSQGSPRDQTSAASVCGRYFSSQPCLPAEQGGSQGMPHVTRASSHTLHAEALRRFGQPRLDLASPTPQKEDEDESAMADATPRFSTAEPTRSALRRLTSQPLEHRDSAQRTDEKGDETTSTASLGSPRPSRDGIDTTAYSSSMRTRSIGSMSTRSSSQERPIRAHENIFSRLPPGYTPSCLGQLVDLSQDNGHFRDLDKYMQFMAVHEREEKTRAEASESGADDEAVLKRLARIGCPLYTGQHRRDIGMDSLASTGDEHDHMSQCSSEGMHDEIVSSGFMGEGCSGEHFRCVHCECGHLASHVALTLRETNLMEAIQVSPPIDGCSHCRDMYYCPDYEQDPEIRNALEDFGAAEDKTIELEELKRIKDHCYARLEEKVARGEMPPLKEPAPQLLLLQQMQLQQQQMILQMQQQQQQQMAPHVPHPPNLPPPPPHAHAIPPPPPHLHELHPAARAPNQPPGPHRNVMN